LNYTLFFETLFEFDDEQLLSSITSASNDSNLDFSLDLFFFSFLLVLAAYESLLFFAVFDRLVLASVFNLVFSF